MLHVQPWIDNDLGDIFLFVAPNLIHRRSLLKRDAMADDVARIDLPFFNSFQKRLIALAAAASFPLMILTHSGQPGR